MYVTQHHAINHTQQRIQLIAIAGLLPKSSLLHKLPFKT